MRSLWRESAVTFAPGAVLALWTIAAATVFALTLAPPERAAFEELVQTRLGLIVLAWLVVSAALGAALRRAWLHWSVAPARLAEQAQIALAANAASELAGEGDTANRALALSFNTLLAERAALRADMSRKVQEASREIEQERSRLAALMAELTQSVVVCNLDGRVLLYNNRARLQFRALSQAPASAGGADLIGIGRSIYAVLDRKLVAHALESVQQRLQRGAAHPSAQFVTSTRGGQLLRVQMAPVGAIPSGVAPVHAIAPQAALNGFVLMLDNITHDFADESLRDQLLHGLTEGSRASLGNLRAAVEMLDFDDVDAPARERFHAVIRDEVHAMNERLQGLAAYTAQTRKTRWPLEDMLGADLVAAAQRRIETLCGCSVDADEIDSALWLRVDSYSLLQALAGLAGRLAGEYEVRRVRLRLASAGTERAQLDLVWAGQGLSTETVTSWETDTLRVGADASALTVREVVERHGGAFWFERERVRHEAFFRFLLPQASAQEPLDAALVLRGDSRPETYDFDLFKATAQSDELAALRLADLSYTVFDTETTGLDPSAGDEIIQIGATRIVACKLRRQESFEQLVDPQRSLPAAGIAIHGIQPAMLAGQPTIAAVLPAFHAFAHDSVLVAHNAAFDMRFLELKEASTGVRFEQPVLDTLLLSALLHPNQASHRLEEIAARFDVALLGRHTALGDAMVTAEVFLKMIPLLAAMGIHTLGEAREAAQKTYFARVKY